MRIMHTIPGRSGAMHRGPAAYTSSSPRGTVAKAMLALRSTVAQALSRPRSTTSQQPQASKPRAKGRARAWLSSIASSSLAHHQTRKLTLSVRPKVRLERQRWRVCRAAADTGKTANAATGRPRPDGRELVLPEKAPPSPTASSGADPKLLAVAKLVVGGAVAMAVLAAGYQVSSHLISSLESVPPLAHLELLLGIVVSARALTVYFNDQGARTVVDKSVVSAVEGVKVAIGLDNLHQQAPPLTPHDDLSLAAQRIAACVPSGTTKHEPTMLEVEVRSLVDGAMAVALDTATPSAVTVDRKALIEAVTEYIRSREQQVRVGQEQLLEDLKASEAIRVSLVELQKSKVARSARRAAEAATIAKIEQLQVESLLLEAGHNADNVDDLPSNLSSLGLKEEESCPSPASEESANVVEDELEQAKERAMRFRAKLDAMKQSKKRRQGIPLGLETDGAHNIQ